MRKPSHLDATVTKLCIMLFCMVSFSVVYGQNPANYIRSKEGKPMFQRKAMLISCLKNYKKDRNDEVAVKVCECYLDKLDKSFTNKQYKEHSKNHVVDLEALINTDPTLKKTIEECFTASGQSILMSVESFREENVAECIASIQKNSNKSLDSLKVKAFCNCQLELIKTKKLNDTAFQQINNPNSLLYYELMYKCGSPFEGETKYNNEWNENVHKDITGNNTDTIQVLNFNGITYVKLKIAGEVLFWLFDTGASDMLITKEMEADWLSKNILTKENYIGINEYEMANGSIDSCRKYIIQGVTIGEFHVNNVAIAVSDKAKKIILGRSLLNKFKEWILDNKNNALILTR